MNIDPSLLPIDLQNWLVIENSEVPIDGTPILGWCIDSADLGSTDGGKTLTNYQYHKDEIGCVNDGPNVICYFPSEQDGDWETGYCTIPGGWFLYIDYDDRKAANPILWKPISS